MSARVLMKGNEAIAEAAIRGGCKYFFGYPITPQSEIPEYMARRLPEIGGVFLQAESEVSAINMVYGAAGAGGRVMTSSSGPGISLKQEGISYIAAAELPCVIVNMVRAGPGLGGILPAQSDYFQATRGGGHGDYRLIVLGPASVQEAADHMMGAFDLAEKYRTPVMILGDGILGQMMEALSFPEREQTATRDREWVTDGAKGRPARVVNTLELVAEKMEQHNFVLEAKYNRIKEAEVRFEEYRTEDAEILVVAYGIVSRICRSAVDKARESGIKLGLFRPISLWPFPEKQLRQAAARAKALLVVEMSMGQMLEDVRLAAECVTPEIDFIGHAGGVVPTPAEILERVSKLANRSKGGE